VIPAKAKGVITPLAHQRLLISANLTVIARPLSPIWNEHPKSAEEWKVLITRVADGVVNCRSGEPGAVNRFQGAEVGRAGRRPTDKPGAEVMRS
jgi:hypothetical protein